MSQALDEWQLSKGHGFFNDDAVIEFGAAIEELGGELSSEQQQKVEKVRQGRMRLFERRALAQSLYIQQSDRYDACAKLGRNYPCWCGSGKKYKK